jgi:hypothetical protein
MEILATSPGDSDEQAMVPDHRSLNSESNNHKTQSVERFAVQLQGPLGDGR